MEHGGGLLAGPDVIRCAVGHSSSILRTSVAELGDGVAAVPVVGLVAVPPVAGDQVGQQRSEQLGGACGVVGVPEPVDLAEPTLGQVGDLPEHGVVGVVRGLVRPRSGGGTSRYGCPRPGLAGRRARGAVHGSRRVGVERLQGEDPGRDGGHGQQGDQRGVVLDLQRPTGSG